MNAREKILGKLRGQERDVALPLPFRSRRHYEDLAGQFELALRAAGGEVNRAGSMIEAFDQAVALLRQMEASRIVVNAEHPLTKFDVSAHEDDVEWFIVGQTDGDLRAFCAMADVGMSGADAALAETGSIIISSGPTNSRLATLLPPVHLALVPTSLLTTDVFTWTAARREPPPANMTIISGPSKTGDIEQTLATGVHGPKRFIVVLYDD